MHRIDQLKGDLVGQGRRVLEAIELGFEAFLERREDLARRVIELDDEVDRVDVEIEKAAVKLLEDATDSTAKLGARPLRAVLTIVKVNNELERIADLAVGVAEGVAAMAGTPGEIPATFRVLANSVAGILRDVTASLDHADAGLARVVLQSEEAVLAFKSLVLRDAEQHIARGTMTVDFAFALHEVASACERMADHCTNIAEQVIYSATGAIVRHQLGQWVDVAPRPGAG